MINQKKFLKIKTEISKKNSNTVLVAVSKKQSVEKIRELYLLGQRVFAENYVQELIKKSDLLKDLKIKWHFIGPLQTNKVNKIVGEVDLIHSVESIKLAEKINQMAAEKNIKQDILIQINIANEKTKKGISPEKIGYLLDSISKLKNICIKGFMLMPPLSDKAEESRAFFSQGAKLLLEHQKRIKTLKYLSMGTTQDYNIALEEGSTHIRVGEAIFGKRE